MQILGFLTERLGKFHYSNRNFITVIEIKIALHQIQCLFALYPRLKEKFKRLII